MGKLLTVQSENEDRIERLKKQTGLKTKIDVVRARPSGRRSAQGGRKQAAKPGGPIGW